MKAGHIVMALLLFLLACFILALFGYVHKRPLKHNLISYKAGHSHKLTEPYSIDVPIKDTARHDLISLENGRLTIDKGYDWNGVTTLPTKNRLRASLVHDALYDLLAHKKLHERSKKIIDDIYVNIAIEDGEPYLTAIFMKLGLRALGHWCVNRDAILHSP